MLLCVCVWCCQSIENMKGDLLLLLFHSDGILLLVGWDESITTSGLFRLLSSPAMKWEYNVFLSLLLLLERRILHILTCSRKKERKRGAIKTEKRKRRIKKAAGIRNIRREFAKKCEKDGVGCTKKILCEKRTLVCEMIYCYTHQVKVKSAQSLYR